MNNRTLGRVSLGKLLLTEHLAWAAPPAWCTWDVELWGWILPLHCSMEERAAPGVPRLHLPRRARDNSCVLPRSLCPHIPAGRELLCPSVALPGLLRMTVTTACLVFPSFILCPCLHFLIKQFNFVLLLPLLQSPLLWHSSLSILSLH